MRVKAGYVLLGVLFLLGYPSRSEAALLYLDPTTGSMVLQVVMGGVLAALAATKVYWHRIRSIFRKPPKD
jgi:hypothetical protein